MTLVAEKNLRRYKMARSLKKGPFVEAQYNAEAEQHGAMAEQQKSMADNLTGQISSIDSHA